jgi:hypothetical protein
MKKKYIIIAFSAALLIFTAYGFMMADKKAATTLSATNGFAVVELFTSEGCSSCPPADEAIATLLAKNIKNVYILAYHVDYWNRLGWKDQFSKPEYSQRQSQYASILGLSSVYTPQVIINGSLEFVGSDEDKLNETVEDNLQTVIKQNVTINPVRLNNTITVNYNTGGNDEVLLNLALVQAEATTSVKRGENGGRVLHHVNIVRVLKTVDAKGEGKLTIDIPSELNNASLQLIAYTQEKENFKILGADQKAL